MGFLNWLGFGPQAPALGVQSPWAPTDNMVTFAAEEVLGAMSEAGAITREIALRVPAVKRAHGIHCSIVSGLPFFQMDGDQRTTEQPAWLTRSASGISPRYRMFGVTSDLFMTGWACLGFTDDYSDAMHVPYGAWGVDRETGRVTINNSIPAAYRARPVAIPLGYGENGILVDGIDSLRGARLIERIWLDRVENPRAQTDIHLTDSRFDEMTRKEQFKLIDAYNAGRRRSGGSTSVSKSFMEIKDVGSTDADLMEKGRNAVRLDIANHAAVPASIVEGAKDGGGTDINYSNDATERNELYDFGTKKFVDAIEARLSLDDVCAEGLSIRADLTGLMTFPSPNINPTSAD